MIDEQTKQQSKEIRVRNHTTEEKHSGPEDILPP